MSPEQARTILKQQYAAIGSVKPVAGEINLEFLEALLNKVTVKDRAVFSRQFSVMINAGVAIVRCLGVLSEQCPNPKFKKALVGISGDVQQGNNLSESMAKYPECFDQLYVSMVEAGEAGGVLDEVLNRLSKLLEDMARLQNQIKSAIGNIGTYDANNPDIRYSLRSTKQAPDTPEFKRWFGDSYFTTPDGKPLVMYHGTARDITIFKGKQAKAIFVTTKPDVAEDYANMGVDYMRTEAYKALTRDEKAELIAVVAEQAERDGKITKVELKEIQSNLKKRVPPIDPEKNRIINLPYQIEGEIIESLNNLLPTKGNIMPVYVNARNVFDYANKDHVNKVYGWMMNNSRALGRMQNPEQWLKKIKDLISRGNWVRIESEDVQEAIRALDFDGFSVLEAGSKNYAV